VGDRKEPRLDDLDRNFLWRRHGIQGRVETMERRRLQVKYEN